MKFTLFVTPILPNPSGSGSAMRASATLEALAARQPVIVVNAELWGDRPGIFDPEWARCRAAALFRVRADRLRDIRALVEDFLAGVPGGGTLDVVYAFRQAVAPAALACVDAAGGRARVTVLDLDDDECARTEPFAVLHEAAGRTDLAGKLRRDLPQLIMVRRMVMSRFQHVLLANAADLRALQRQHPDVAMAQLPNVIRLPESATSGTPRDPNRMLFVGTLDYFPNEDAILHFVGDILPSVRAQAPGMHVRIVGVGQSDAVAAAAGADGVQLVGAVPELVPEYAAAGMAVVPLRAGSGTRIKILEAFAHGVPVVATPLGADGLDVTDGEQLLLAESPTDFAAACVRLATDAALGERLVRSAAAWVRTHHTPEAIARVLERLLAPETLGSGPA
jgi:hypothetical protein